MKHFKQSFLFYLLLLIVVFKGYGQEGQKEQTSKVPYYNAVQWVNPMIDAANSRWFYFSSACRPFGMVNLSPDTRIGGAWGAGYRYERDTIVGFSHIHAWQLAGVSVLPVVEDVDPRKGVEAYESKFSHQREEARPGYHYVHLDRYGVDAELTSTTRVGFHRYTFPASEESRILFDLGGRLGPSQMTEGEARIVNDKEIAGYTVNGPTRRRPKEYPVFFVARFSKPFESMDGWQGENLMQDIEEVSGSESGIMINFNTSDDEEILMKVGISYCSPEQARLNLETELAHWDFDRVVKESAEEWNNWLSKIQIRGGSDKEKTRFYTDLWHALQGRRIISDVNGKYSDYTGEKRRVRQLPIDEQGNPEFNYYNSDSFWGAQWTLNTLWHLVYPEVSEEFINSMLTMYKDGGLIPRGPSGGNYTFVMTGASSTPFIASAWQKGIRGFDPEMAYEGMKKNHLPGGLMSKAGYEHETNKGGGIEYYMDRGYVPEGIEARGFHLDGAGMTLEYAYQDWCLAQMADALGKDRDKERFLARSRNYRNLYNPSTGWMRPKNMDGVWIEPFEPLNSEGFVESNAAQMTWFVPHDVKGLAELMGGYEALTDKLNRSFERARPVDFVDSDSWVNYSNQPSMQMAHIFNYSEAPWLTQYWTRQVIETSFSGVTPQSGYNGDEDQGLMGALSVLMKTGLFELHGGAAKKPFYEIGSPIFDKITIYLNNDYYPGEKFVIETFNNKEENYYIQGASLNQSPHSKPFILHEKVIKGGKLELRMGDNPNKSWGEHSPSNLLSN
ncbi:MAG: GH92 family glycosyl hydrolase [bacterium]